MSFFDFVDRKLSKTNVKGWTPEERQELANVKTHIRENSATTKWLHYGKRNKISFLAFTTGTKNPEHCLPPLERWIPENMKHITHIAALRIRSHMCTAVLMGTTWYTLGLSVKGGRIKEVNPEHTPIISRKTISLLRPIVPELTKMLKETSLVSFHVPDTMIVEEYTDIVNFVQNACPTDFKNALARKEADEFSRSLVRSYDKDMDTLEVAWVGLCPETTKAALEKVKFTVPLEKGRDYTAGMGRFRLTIARLRGYVASFNEAETFGVGAGYSQVLNNCVTLAQSLTGLPCSGLGITSPGMCEFNRNIMEPDMSFLRELIFHDELKLARSKRPLQIRLSDWIVSCQASNVDELLQSVNRKDRFLLAVATYKTYIVLCVGFREAYWTGKKKTRCTIDWVPLYITKEKGFQLANIPQTVEDVRQRFKVFAIADATTARIELEQIVRSRSTNGTPIAAEGNTIERVVRKHNKLCEGLSKIGIWDRLFIKDSAVRQDRGYDFINEFEVP